MFKEWYDVAKELGNNRNKSTIEKAKKISRKYIIRGRILKIIGIIGVIASLSTFIFFSIKGSEYGIPVLIASGLAFPLTAALIGIGASYSSIGKRLNILIEQPPLIQNANNSNTININEAFSTNNDKKAEKVCPICGHVNDIKNSFCGNCGEDLRD